MGCRTSKLSAISPQGSPSEAAAAADDAPLAALLGAQGGTNAPGGEIRAVEAPVVDGGAAGAGAGSGSGGQAGSQASGADVARMPRSTSSPLGSSTAQGGADADGALQRQALSLPQGRKSFSRLLERLPFVGGASRRDSAASTLSDSEDSLEVQLARERKRMAAEETRRRRTNAFPPVLFSSGQLELMLCSHPTGFDACEGWDEFGRVETQPEEESHEEIALDALRGAGFVSPEGSGDAVDVMAMLQGVAAGGAGADEGSDSDGGERSSVPAAARPGRLSYVEESRARSKSQIGDGGGGFGAPGAGANGKKTTGATMNAGSSRGRNADPVAKLTQMLNTERARRVALETQLAANLETLQHLQAAVPLSADASGPDAAQAQRRKMLAAMGERSMTMAPRRGRSGTPNRSLRKMASAKEQGRNSFESDNSRHSDSRPGSLTNVDTDAIMRELERRQKLPAKTALGGGASGGNDGEASNN